MHLERAYGLGIARGLTSVAVSAITAAGNWCAHAITDRRLADKARRDRAALLSMSDHMLRDIGVTRLEITLVESPPQRSDL
jgi:hypothetical protein